MDFRGLAISQEQKEVLVGAMSAIGGKADIAKTHCNVCF
jgi:hypothetical protein